jgi:hypothetical protein
MKLQRLAISSARVLFCRADTKWLYGTGRPSRLPRKLFRLCAGEGAEALGSLLAAEDPDRQNSTTPMNFGEVSALAVARNGEPGARQGPWQAR